MKNDLDFLYISFIMSHIVNFDNLITVTPDQYEGVTTVMLHSSYIFNISDVIFNFKNITILSLFSNHISCAYW